MRQLDSDKIIKTIAELHSRIVERFPNANLADVCEEYNVPTKPNHLKEHSY